MSSSVYNIRLVAHQSVSLRTRNRIVEGLLGQVAGLVRRAENLIVKDGEVQRETQTDRVRWRQVSHGNVAGCLVCLERLFG